MNDDSFTDEDVWWDKVFEEKERFKDEQGCPGGCLTVSCYCRKKAIATVASRTGVAWAAPAYSTDAAALRAILSKAGIEHSEAGAEGVIEAQDKSHNSVWFVFNEDGSLKSIMGGS